MNNKWKADDIIQVEIILVPLSFIIGFIVYILSLPMIEDSSFSFESCLWSGALAFLFVQLIVGSYLMESTQKILGIRKKQRVQHFVPQIKAFNKQEVIYLKDKPKQEERQILVNGKEKVISLDSNEVQLPTKQEFFDTLRKTKEDIDNSVYFTSSDSTGNLQLSGKTMVMFLVYAHKWANYGRGLSRNTWIEPKIIGRFEHWWLPHYYDPAISVIEFSQQKLGIQIMTNLSANNWRRLNIHPKQAFSLLCLAYFYDEIEKPSGNLLNNKKLLNFVLTDTLKKIKGN